MFNTIKLSENLEEARKSVEDILKDITDQKVKILVIKGKETFETNLIFLKRYDGEKISQMFDEVKEKYPSGGFTEIQLHSAPIKMDGYKFHHLSKNLNRAIASAKDILKYQSRKEKVQAKLSVKRGNIKYETSLIYLRSENPEIAEQFRNELSIKFEDDTFDEIVLLTKKLQPFVIWQI